MFIKNIHRDILILTLQMAIIKNAEISGWNVKRLNNKQIELSRKINKNIDYDRVCCDLILNCSKFFPNVTC